MLRRGTRYRPRPAEEAGDDARAAALHTLDIWNDHLATVGSQLLYARLRLLRDLGPDLSKADHEVSAGQSDARVADKSSLREEVAASIAAGEVPQAEELRAQILAALEEARPREVERGVSLAGPHRDDVSLTLGELPAKGYASHGEPWSFALGLKLAAYQLLRHDLGEDPVLDPRRRVRRARLRPAGAAGDDDRRLRAAADYRCRGRGRAVLAGRPGVCRAAGRGGSL